MKKVGQREKSHGKEIDPDELANRPVVVDPFGDMKEETIDFSHRGRIVKWPVKRFQPCTAFSAGLLFSSLVPGDSLRMGAEEIPYFFL